MNGNQETLWDSIGNDRNNIPLNITMDSSSNLFQVRNAFESSETSMGMKNREVEVNFGFSNSLDAPLCIMIPKLFVPMMQGFRCKKIRWVR